MRDNTKLKAELNTMRDKYRDTENEYNITLRKLEEKGLMKYIFLEIYLNNFNLKWSKSFEEPKLIQTNNLFILVFIYSFRCCIASS